MSVAPIQTGLTHLCRLDVLFITETWLDITSSFTLREASAANYNFPHVDREDKRGVRVEGIVSDSLNCHQVSLGDYQSF